jgi:L-ascorbate metabolism protein UlaG (beta-lactamase superfamily)
MGSMLDFESPTSEHLLRMYITGDTVIHDDLNEIPKRFPGVDLALLHLGGTRVMGILVTMDDEQGVEMMRIIQPETAIPIHYNDYDVFKSPLEDFRRAVEKAGLADKVVYLSHGEAYEFRLHQAEQGGDFSRGMTTG